MPKSNQDRRSEFDAWPPGFEEVHGYKLKFLARGYEHLVYQVADHPKIVIKFSTHKIKEFLSLFDNDRCRPTSEDLEKFARTRFQPDIAFKNRQIAELRRHYGYHRTLREKRYLIKIPAPIGLLALLYREDFWGRTLPTVLSPLEQVWTHVAVQSYCSLSPDPTCQSLSFGRFTEDGHVDSGLYQRVTRQLLEQGSEQVLRNEFLQVQDHSEVGNLRSLLLIADRDPNLVASLRDFVQRTMSYTASTGHILALAGANNLILLRTGAVWDYLMLDVLPIPEGPIWAAALMVADRHAKGLPLGRRELELAKRALNFARLMNGLASCVGMKDRLLHSEQIAPLSTLDLAPDGHYAW